MWQLYKYVNKMSIKICGMLNLTATFITRWQQFTQPPSYPFVAISLTSSTSALCLWSDSGVEELDTANGFMHTYTAGPVLLTMAGSGAE